MKINIKGKEILISLVIIFQYLNLFGQFQIPKTPTTFQFSPISTTKSYQTETHKQNPTKINGLDIHELEVNKHKERQQHIAEIKREAEEYEKYIVKYELPSFRYNPTTVYYRKAFEELKEMEDSTFSIKRSNFIIENAFFDNRGNYDEFEKIISQIGQFLNWKMEELNYNKNSNLAKNLILFQFFSDTMKVESKNLEHLPFKYDFNDYYGHNDWASMFVKKLLKTGKGQCHSLPLLYLILAEEIKAKAYLATSPNHSYIKFQDDNKKWINIELTNNMLTTNAFLLQSGYIKAEALQNGIYMQPFNQKQLLSQQMADLANGYIKKYGYDEFVEEVIKKAIELYPNNAFAQMIKSDYRTMYFMYVQRQLNVAPKDIDKYPIAKVLLDKMYEQYNLIDNLGYEEMPLDEYGKWLNSLNEEKKKQESQHMIKKLEQSKSVELKL